jgi:hypothetical protein
MYFAEPTNNGLMVFDASNNNGVHMPIVSDPDKIKNYNLNGNTMSVSYTDGRTEIYNVENRSRIR